MSTLTQLIDAFMASDSPADIGSHGWLHFWREELGHMEVREIRPDHVDGAIVKRGKLKAGRNMDAIVLQVRAIQSAKMSNLDRPLICHTPNVLSPLVVF